MRRSQLAAAAGFKSPFVCPVKSQALATTPAAQPEAKKARTAFQCPVKALGTSSTGATTTAKAKEDSELESRAYKVFWTNASRKKHKTFADGVLVLVGLSATLLDEEGKDVAKCRNMGRSNIESLVPGNTLLVQNKELEIDKQIPYEDYLSGRVFVTTTTATAAAAASTPTAHAQTSASKAAAKPFRQVLVGSKARQEQQRAEEAVLPPPRHDPSAPDALVLDAGGPDRVAIVVDPHIARRLRPHQREGVRFVYECVSGKRGVAKGCILADEMGLGKSLQALTVLWTLLKQGPRGVPTVAKVIVVCPNTLIGNWVQEFAHWLGSERLVPVTLGSAKSKAECARMLREFKSDRHPVLVISYEQLRNNVEALVDCRCGLLICDEAHRIKNAQSKTAVALARLHTERASRPERVLQHGRLLCAVAAGHHGCVPPHVRGAHRAGQRPRRHTRAARPGAPARGKPGGRDVERRAAAPEHHPDKLPAPQDRAGAGVPPHRAAGGRLQALPGVQVGAHHAGRRKHAVAGMHPPPHKDLQPPSPAAAPRPRHKARALF